MSWSSRRRNQSPKEPASIGDTHVVGACSKITSMMQTTANLMVPYSPSREEVLPMLFADDTLVKLKAVRGMVEPTYLWEKYPVATDIELQIGFRDALVPTIEPEFLCVQPERASPLLNAIEEIRAIYLQYEKVKHVLRWMNRNATLGAIRHYWPAAMQLCPEAFRGLPDTASRFKTPKYIHEKLQLIRDSAATVAASALLPTDAAPRVTSPLMLIFNSDESQGFTTDELHVHI